MGRSLVVATRRCWMLASAVLAASAVFASAAQAVITVNTTADPGAAGLCSLRKAIEAANTAAAAGDCAAAEGAGSTTTIVVPAGHYVLATQLDIAQNAMVAIEGASA